MRTLASNTLVIWSKFYSKIILSKYLEHDVIWKMNNTGAATPASLPVNSAKKTGVL